MKSGLIVYLTGGTELPEGFDLLSRCREMGFTADRAELVGSRQGFYEVNDAWHYLFTKGYGDIKLLDKFFTQKACREHRRQPHTHRVLCENNVNVLPFLVHLPKVHNMPNNLG